MLEKQILTIFADRNKTDMDYWIPADTGKKPRLQNT